MKHLKLQEFSVLSVRVFGHNSSSCLNKTLFIKEQEDMSEEDNCDDKVYEPNLDDFQDLNEDDESNLLRCVIHSNQDNQVRCG